MNIAEYVEIESRVAELESNINKCYSELKEIQKQLSHIDGTDNIEINPDHFHDGHTPYFDVIGENGPKNSHKI